MMTVDEALTMADSSHGDGLGRILAAEVRRLRKDAERGQFLMEHGEWFRHNHDAAHAYALLAVRLPYTADLSCKAMREDAIDAARSAKT